MTMEVYEARSIVRGRLDGTKMKSLNLCREDTQSKSKEVGINGEVNAAG